MAKNYVISDESLDILAKAIKGEISLDEMDDMLDAKAIRDREKQSKN